MIKVEGFKAFRGTMRIKSSNPKFRPLIIRCDWLYKPEYNCWYGQGHSFDAEICEILDDETE